MMGIGFAELAVILVIIMIIFGAGKLPQIGSAFGQSIRNFKTSMREVDEMEAQEKVEEATLTSNAPSGDTQVASLPASGVVEPAAAPVANVTNSQPAPAPATAKAAPAKAPAQASTAKAPAQGASDPKAKKGKGKEEKSFEEELIEQAIKELKDKRVGTIRTPHDGLVQQGDVFTKSVDRTPWHMKGRDRGVNRDVL